jgi:hypothetical protein
VPIVAHIKDVRKAREFAQSIACLAVALQDELDRASWEQCADTLDSIAGDLEQLTAFVTLARVPA